MSGALGVFGVGVFVMVAVLIFLLANSVRILAEYERGVVFRLGRLRPSEYGPGLILLIPVCIVSTNAIV